MSPHSHAIVWIDHRQARVLHFNATDVEPAVVHPVDPHVHVHHKANTVGSGHAPPDRAYLQKVVDKLAGTTAALIVGPSTAKTELEAFIAENDPALLGRVAAVQPMDRASDGELVAHARKFFKANDRMRLPS